MKLKRIVVVLVCLFGLIVASGYALLTTRTGIDQELALAELQIAKMTCGSCVAKISTALNELSGVESVAVSVTTGIGKVTFNPQLVGTDELTATVTQAGYPATLKQLLSSEQYHALQTEENRLATNYVARIGEQLISRTEFEQQVTQALQTAGMQDRPELRNQALSQAWQAVMQKTLLLQAAEQNQVVVHDGEVDLRIQKMGQGMPNLEDYIQTRYGSRASFQHQLKQEMIISRNIDQFVLAQEQDNRKRQLLFNQWFQALVNDASIVIYDQQLKQLAGAAGGCGGGCCG